MRYLVALSFSLLALGNLNGQNPYPHLKVLKIPNEYCGDEPFFNIHYEASLGEVINTKRNELAEDHIRYLTDNIEEHDLVALKLKFNSTELDGEYYLEFSYGPSCDPGFYLIDAQTQEVIASTDGMNIYIPGGNSVYTTGHLNTTYNKRRKYSFDGIKFKEIEPDFYYIGLKTKTLKPIILYADQDLTTQLAYLPADYSVEVVAARASTARIDEIKYLIKTELGLLGWSNIETTAFKSLQIEGIMFLGD